MRGTRKGITVGARAARFLLGLFLLAVFYSIFASGYTPPGIAGEVLRHNRECDIDASPLWYMEVENMQEIERAVQTMRELAKNELRNSDADGSGEKQGATDTVSHSEQPIDRPHCEHGRESEQ